MLKDCGIVGANLQHSFFKVLTKIGIGLQNTETYHFIKNQFDSRIQIGALVLRANQVVKIVGNVESVVLKISDYLKMTNMFHCRKPQKSGYLTIPFVRQQNHKSKNTCTTSKIEVKTKLTVKSNFRIDSIKFQTAYIHS